MGTICFATHMSSPLLFMQQGEQRASGDVLGDDGKLAGVIQTRPDKVDDTGVIESAEDGDLPAEHVHVRLGAVRVGSITANNREELIGLRPSTHEENYGSF